MGGLKKFFLSGGVSPLNPFLAPPGPTDRLFFDATTGNMISEDLSQVWPANGSPLYQQAGPAGTGLDAIQSPSSSDYFDILANNTNSALIPGTGNFTIVIQLKSPNAGGTVQFIIDWGHEGIQANSGYSLVMSSSAIQFQVGGPDGSGFGHITNWTLPASTLFKENKWYTLTWQFDKTQTKGNLIVKPEGGSQFVATTTSIGFNLNTIGNVDSSSRNFRLFDSFIPTGRNFPGFISQIIFAMGTATYDLPVKP